MNTTPSTEQQQAIDQQVAEFLRANPSRTLAAITEGTGLRFTAVRRAVQRQFAKRIVNNGDEGSEFEIKWYVRKKCPTN